MIDDEKYTLKITNKRIWDFYNNNKNVNIEAVNLILLDLLDKINNDMSNVMSSAINNEILSHVKDLKRDMCGIENSIILKLHDINKDYIENVKLIIINSSSESLDKIIKKIDNHTDIFINSINNEIPQQNKYLENGVKGHLLIFQEKITSELKNEINNNSNKEYISTIDKKIQQMQEPLLSFITKNQEHMTSALSNLKEENAIGQVSQNKVIDELGTFLNKYRTNSNYKGKSSENMLELTLNKMYPTGEIVNSSSSLKLAGDFILKREGKKSILIENKNYDLAIQKEGVEKFLRDIRAQKCNGIFLSQHSGIQYKPNFFIEIEDNNVLIYLHNVEYSEDKIKAGIDIIDKLSDKLNELNIDEKDGTTIEKDILDKINSEFQTFIAHKENMIFSLKESQKLFISQFEDLNMPNLSIYLNSKYASMQNQKWICDICNETFVKKVQLTVHKKKHNNNSTLNGSLELKAVDIPKKTRKSVRNSKITGEDSLEIGIIDINIPSCSQKKSKNESI